VISQDVSQRGDGLWQIGMDDCWSRTSRVSRIGAGHAGIERRNIEELNAGPNENLRIVKTKELRRFGLSLTTGCMIAELAFFAGCPR
jgi:hypothetical protein